jgi:uncharacterized protein YbjT (DUF2867 family)
MFLVTGASGNIGGQVARRLLDAGHPVRVFVRDPARLGDLEGRVEVALGDFGRPETLGAAAFGTRAVFLNTGPHLPGLDALLAALKAHGAPRVAFLSTILAGHPEFAIGRMHKANEDAVRAAGLRATFLRPAGFMSNALRWAESIRADGVVHNPMGAGQAAPVAPEDIAAAAVRALATDDFLGEAVELTGGELLSVPDQVDILSRTLGRPLRIVDVPMQASIDGMLRAGVPEPIARGVAQSQEGVRDGRFRAIAAGVERLTGAAPMRFEAWARKHASAFA